MQRGRDANHAPDIGGRGPGQPLNPPHSLSTSVPALPTPLPPSWHQLSGWSLLPLSLACWQMQKSVCLFGVTALLRSLLGRYPRMPKRMTEGEGEAPWCTPRYLAGATCGSRGVGSAQTVRPPSTVHWILPLPLQPPPLHLRSGKQVWLPLAWDPSPNTRHPTRDWLTLGSPSRCVSPAGKS